jgi:hypothetical protein
MSPEFRDRKRSIDWSANSTLSSETFETARSAVPVKP